MAETHRVKHTSLEASVASMPSLQSKLGEAYASGGLVMSIKLKMRELAELDSNPVGAVDAGTRVQIIEHCQLPDGTKRARIALQEDADAKPMGWVSLYSKEDGAAHLVDDGKRVREIFKQLDRNDDQKISRMEFRQGARDLGLMGTGPGCFDAREVRSMCESN